MAAPETALPGVADPAVTAAPPVAGAVDPALNGDAYTMAAAHDPAGAAAQAMPPVSYTPPAADIYTPVPYTPPAADIYTPVPYTPPAADIYTPVPYVDPASAMVPVVAAVPMTVPGQTAAPPEPPRPLTPEEYNTFLVKPESPWPPPIFVRPNVHAEERFYLDNRWYSQWKFFDKKANENKKRYHQLQMIIGVGSVAVPVLVGINSVDPVWQQVLYWVTVTISLAVAISAAVENIYKYGDNWRSYRQAAEELQQEKFLYDVKAGRYAGNAAGFARFAERTEEIIAKQNGQFMQTVERQQSQAAEQNAELLSKYQTEGQNRLTDFSSGGTYSSSGGVFVSGGSVMPGGAAPDVPGMTPTLPVSAPAPVLDTSSAG